MVLFACLLAAACSKLDELDDTEAEKAGVAVLGQSPGATPFIAHVVLGLDDIAELDRVSFLVAPKPGTVSRPVTVTYSRAWLERKGAWRAGDKQLRLALFGLYASHQNTVTLTAGFRDGSTHVERLTVATPAYSGPADVYLAPRLRTPLTAGAAPGVDYVLLQNAITSPAVVDTDGNLRWLGAGPANSYTATFAGDAFLVGSATTPELFRVELDGTYATTPLASTRYTNFHHDLARGKAGLLAELDALEGGVPRIESILAEISPQGEVLKEWDMAAIFRAAMRAGGDDPSGFVRDGIDWFHMNSAIYVAADDSLLISSREHFVVKIDYATGRIRWLLGDTTKDWYVNYPSLRALALKLTSGKAPIGQHSLSIAANGELLLFNNGAASDNQPAGAPRGLSRDFATPSRYAIDETARTARETWSYAPTPAIASQYCSSVYESTPGHYLVTYSLAEAGTRVRLIGVDEAGAVAFDFDYPTNGCDTAFIGKPLDFSALTLH
ncbi:aryl-sulfate sulfotransferase [Massilia sp. SYSU DXS3249]